MPWMKVVGECVGRVPSGRSVPRGETAPPYTVTALDTRLIASYVSASSARYAAGAALDPVERELRAARSG